MKKEFGMTLLKMLLPGPPTQRSSSGSLEKLTAVLRVLLRSVHPGAMQFFFFFLINVPSHDPDHAQAMWWEDLHQEPVGRGASCGCVVTFGRGSS